MATKAKPGGSGSRAPRKVEFSLEQSPWYAPAAFGVIAIAIVIMFHKFFFSDDMLNSSDTITAGIFFRSFYKDFFVAHGHMPSWNPYIFGGLPFVDAFHGDILYPIANLYRFFMETTRFVGFTLILHIYLAGLFMYFCARQFKLSKTPALFSAVAYMFAASLVSEVAPGHDGKMYVMALFPLAIMFLDRAFEKKPFVNCTFLGLVIGLIILTPHAEMAYFTLWALAAYTIFKLILLYRATKSIMPVGVRGFLVLYAVLIGLALSWIQFGPGLNYTNNFSPRADSKRGWDWATSWSMHPEEAASLLIPEFAGANAKTDGTYYWGRNYFKDNSENVCVAALFLALLGVIIARRKEVYFFLGVAIFALIYALGATTPIFYLFFWLIPKVSMLRAPSVIMFLFTFSVSLVAGMLLQRLVEGARETAGREKWFNYILVGFPGLMFLLAFLFSVAGRSMISTYCSIFYSEAPQTSIGQQGMTKLDVAYMNLPSVQTGAWIAFLVVALAAAFIWLYRNGKVGTGILVAVVMIPMVDGMRFNARFIDTIDPNQNFGPNPIVDFLKQNVGDGRVLNFAKPDDDVLPFHRIDVVVGYHGNQLRWYDDLLGGPQRKNLNNPRFLNLVGTRYILGLAAQQIPSGYFGPAPVVDAASVGKVSVLRNDNALPRAFLVGSYRVVPDRQQIYPLVLAGTDDLRTHAFLEEQPELKIDSSFAPGDSAWVINHGVDTVQVGLKTSTNKVLILTDVYYDAWHALVGGKPAKLLRSYGAFRAVAVPAGSQAVTFYYDSPRYAQDRLITWLTSLYIVAIIGVHIVQTRRKKKGNVQAES
jgi:hypothetical protein